MTDFAKYFEWKTRDSGEEFVILKDEAPSWMREACRDAMQSDMTDWLWEECKAAFEAIDNESLDEDSTHEYADGRVDVYTRERFRWAADHCLSSTFGEAEERAKELGGRESADVQEILGVVQFCAIEYIAQVILQAVEQNGEDEEEEEIEEESTDA